MSFKSHKMFHPQRFLFRPGHHFDLRHVHRRVRRGKLRVHGRNRNRRLEAVRLVRLRWLRHRGATFLAEEAMEIWGFNGKLTLMGFNGV